MVPQRERGTRRSCASRQGDEADGGTIWAPRRCGRERAGGRFGQRGSVMSSAERFRRYASECLKLAQSATNDSDKALLLHMAESWRRLAERAEAPKPHRTTDQDE